MDLEKLRLHKIGPDDSEIERVHTIRRACARDLGVRFGPGHWATCTSLQHLQKEAERKDLFVVYHHREIVATFALTDEPPEFFDVRNFQHPDDPALYLSSMAVTPTLQCHGIGRWCMQQIDAITIAGGCLSIRFDAYDSPAGAGPFYEHCGYQPRGQIVFNRVPLILFEKTFRSVGNTTALAQTRRS